MRLGICVPMYMVVPASFVVNFIHRLTELHTNGRNYEVKIYMLMGTVIDRARNKLVDLALADECDYVMFLDSDMLLPPNAIDDLIDMKLDIVSGLYFQKEIPYMPVARLKKNETDIDHHFLEDFEFDDVIKVAGVGLGCCLIKSDVFKKMKYPYFKFEWKKVRKGHRVEQVAEDLYFCDNAQKAGYETYLNTGIVCGHVGTAVDKSHFMVYKEQLKSDKIDREDAIKCLMEIDDLSEKEVLDTMREVYKIRNEEWKKVDKNNPKEVEDYYINNNYELYDHVQWHLNNRRNFGKKIVESIKKNYPDKATEILDYGSGGGHIAYLLAKEGYMVTTYEPNKKSNKYMSLRFSKNRVKRKSLNYPIKPDFKNKYDLILCFEVLEHISDEKFEETIKTLDKLRKPGGQIISTVSFGGQKTHPMHYDYTPKKKELIESLTK